MTISIYDLYSHLRTRNNQKFTQIVTESLKPRNPDILYDIFGQLGVNQNHTILDIGCRYRVSASQTLLTR
ncbi:hypothetical protein [Nostoc sp. NOS(2021)]|uniref:hypothetical protein n=1 Tax=Nostoc sp. NOS(2021) TaxID=2815407 RepID=UPI0025FF5A82|nr:hypothetical protein [Nostoc sp. NOS(2021)]